MNMVVTGLRAALRWFGVVLFSLAFLGCLALVPTTVGTSMVFGTPALLATIWLVRHDPAELPDASPPSVVALGVVSAPLFLLIAYLTMQ